MVWLSITIGSVQVLLFCSSAIFDVCRLIVEEEERQTLKSAVREKHRMLIFIAGINFVELISFLIIIIRIDESRQLASALTTIAFQEQAQSN